MTKPRKGQQPGRSFYHISYRNIDALEKGALFTSWKRSAREINGRMPISSRVVFTPVRAHDTSVLDSAAFFHALTPPVAVATFGCAIERLLTDLPLNEGGAVVGGPRPPLIPAADARLPQTALTPPVAVATFGCAIERLLTDLPLNE